MELLTAKEAAKYLRISLFTLSRIEKEALLVPFRTPGGHRRYSRDMLDAYLECSRARPTGSQKRILVVDDREEAVDLLTNTLSSYRFCRAGDSLMVGVQLSEFNPHMILVNRSMSGLDASALCRQLEHQQAQPKILLFDAPREGSGPGFNLKDIGALKDEIERLLIDRI
jgi:excisionase family DNA binding protein